MPGKECKWGSRMKKAKIVITAVVVAALAISAVTVNMYIDRRPWLFGGSGTPDVICLNDGKRLEKVIALRKGYFIKDIRGGSIVFGRTDGRNSAEINGASDLFGNIIVPLGAHDDDIWLFLDENGAVYETTEPYTASEIADKPVGIVTHGSGRKAVCYNVNGCELVSYEGALGIVGPEGTVETLFGSGSGNGWRLEDPLIFGEYIRVRIYWCDCIYRIIHESE